jgi:hypothetical protein
MAYDKGSMSRIGAVPFAAGLSKSEFIYATADTKAQVLGAGYFNADAKRVDNGDMISVIYGIGGTIGRMGLIVTSAKGAATVVVAASGQQALTDNVAGATGAVMSANAVKQLILIPVQLADLAAGEFKVGMQFKYTVLSATFRTAKPATTAAKAATLQPTIASVAMTGGAMALTSANQNTQGQGLAGGAITAGNTGNAGQPLGFTVSAVTAFIEGDGWVEFTVRNEDLADALSSLNAA